MRKITLLFVLFFSLLGFGQTYSVVIEYKSIYGGCLRAGYNYTLTGDNNVIVNHSGDGNVNDSNLFIVSQYNSYSLFLSFYCKSEIGNPISCKKKNANTLTLIELIKGGLLYNSECRGEALLKSFKPNVSINPAPTVICSGEQLNLSASPAGFPNEAYHWQYSTNNVNWQDLPSTVRGIPTNDVPTTKLSISDLLPTIPKFYNKPIYFRLGYRQDRAFTDAISIMYSSCAPIVSAPIEYKSPKCNGNEIEEIKITFDRDLETGEVLNYMSLYDYDDITQMFSQYNGVKYTNKTYFFPVSGLKLISGKKYYVGFSANKNGVETGLINNAKTYFFTYTDPPALTFTLPTAISPLCNNGTGGLTTTVTGGTPKSSGLRYNYYIDNATTPITAGVTEVINQNGSTTATITGLSAASHTIIVTDANDCFEK